MTGQDYESYSFYYENGISIIINELQETYDSVIVNPRAKELIWDTYCEFNRHCKQTYMASSTHLLDRHKVVACYMYAIEKAFVLSSVNSLMQGDSTHIFLNETLAVTFGMSLLRAMIMDAIHFTESDDKTKQGLLGVFDSDIVFPECTHGQFRDNLLSQLSFTRIEGNYNTLSLAETLYLLECFNLVKNGFPSDSLRLELEK